MNPKALALFSLIALLSVVFVLQINYQQPDKGSIEIGGATLHLGMTKATISEKLRGVEIMRNDKDDFWFVGPPPSQSIQFTNGKLSYAGRNWTTYDNDIAQTLHGAVNHFNREGYSQCRVEADSKDEPGNTLQRIWIRCGEKSILIARMSFAGGKAYNTVEEMLGVIH